MYISVQAIFTRSLKKVPTIQVPAFAPDMKLQMAPSMNSRILLLSITDLTQTQCIIHKSIQKWYSWMDIHSRHIGEA